MDDATTQQDFLDQVDASGFAGLYDYAYLPPKRRGHAFVNFRSAEHAAAFAEAWRGSKRLGVRPEAAALDVLPSSVQGFAQNTAKWSPDRMSQTKCVPFICGASAESSREVGARKEGTTTREATTLVVRNLRVTVTQEEFLREVDMSGFSGVYDFAYLPCDFGSGSGSGFAFVNFKSAEIAAAFQRQWHRSMRPKVCHAYHALDVALASVQGFQGNASKWTSARKAKVKNPRLMPFISWP